MPCGVRMGHGSAGRFTSRASWWYAEASFFEKKNYFKSPRITGPASETLNVSGLPPGHYYFQCDVHGPAMSGAFIAK